MIGYGGEGAQAKGAEMMGDEILEGGAVPESLSEEAWIELSEEGHAAVWEKGVPEERAAI